VVFNVFILNENMVANSADGRSRRRRALDHFHFDWEKATQDATKFKAVPCPTEADRLFLLKVIALSQSAIPPFALWDALEAVKHIGPRTPIAYFRTVLADNCRKAGVDLKGALRLVKVPDTAIVAATVQQLEAAALDAHRHGWPWGAFWEQHGADVSALEPHDRRRFHHLRQRLFGLVVAGDLEGAEPAGDGWPKPAPWEIDNSEAPGVVPAAVET
jgi:hypothetical protein